MQLIAGAEPVSYTHLTFDEKGTSTTLRPASEISAVRRGPLVEIASLGIDFALGQNPEQQGYQLVKVLFEYLIKNITPNNEIEIPITIAIDELAYQSRFL